MFDLGIRVALMPSLDGKRVPRVGTKQAWSRQVPKGDHRR
jgi:hypothetical protein